MSLIDRLFNRQKIDCPRCLGKGDVDWDDIKRLNKELKWIPGTCAYCNGKGKVNSGLPSKVAVDTTYLTTSLDPEERRRLLAKDFGAWQRAHYYDMQRDNFFAEVEYLYFTCHIDSDKITDFYLLHQTESESNLDSRNELLDYINRIIERRKRH